MTVMGGEIRVESAPDRLGAICSELEMAGQVGDQEVIAASLPKLHQRLNAVVRLLEQPSPYAPA